MANNANIIAAELSKDELEKSVNEIVKTVETGVNKMAETFDNALAKMTQSLKDFSGNATQNTVQKNKELKDSFDSVAEAIKKATTPSAIGSYGGMGGKAVANARSQEEVRLSLTLRSLERQKNEIQKQIDALENKISEKATNKVAQIEQRIEQAKQRIKGFQAEIAGLEFRQKADGVDNSQAVQVARNNIQRLKQEIAEYQEQIRKAPEFFGKKEIAQINELRQRLQQLSQQQEELRNKPITPIGQKEIANAERYSEEIKKQAQAIRESQQWKEKGFALVPINDTADAVISARNKLSIEEQLLQVEKDKQAEIAKREKEEQKSIETKRQEQAILQQQATTEQEITQIVKSRPKEQKMTFSTYENLRAAIASVLHVQQEEVKIYDTETAAAKNLKTTLNQLTTAYNSLTNAERNSAQGQNLADQIQRTSRALREIQNQMYRPVSLKAALGLDERTLDQISYKIQQLNSYMRGLDYKKSKDEINQVTQAMNRLKQKQNEILGENARLSASNNALARSFNYMKNRLAFYFTVGASTQFVKTLIDIRGQYELLERSIGILIDSAQQGSKIFAELNAMAIKSPFTTMELGAAAKQLVAYDVAAKDVVDTTRRLADMAAAVGIPIERLTYALGQIKAYGYLNARDARMFANAGIPLVKELADYYTQLEGQLISTSDIYDRIKKKAIDYNDVMSVVNKMTDEGGKFFNFQEKAADTLKVRIANLTLAWNNMLNEIGKDNQGILAGALTVTKGIFENWRNISNTLTSIATTFGLIKTFQLLYLLWAKQATTQTGVLAVLQQTFGKKMGENIMNIGMSFTKFLGNPMALAAAAVAGLSIALGKAIMDYRDLQQANENFNKSIADNANENIESIKKFFSEYKTQLETISGAAPSGQQKMWERLQDEIEKTTHNAEQFISALNQIEEIPKRIKLGEAVLEQAKEIGEEIKRLAEQEWFSVGGGFANAPLADNLIEVSKISNGLIKQFGDLKTAEETLGKVIQNSGYTNQWQDYNIAVAEAKNELVNFVSILDKANLAKIMGDDPNTQLANIREFATIIRDSFLATEKGQKITAEGQALLNKYLDEWIAKQGLANGIIKQRQIGSKEFTAAEIANIEASRTAWEDFFNQLNKSDKERLDYLIETNQTGSNEFRELWDKATKDMAENATTSYNLIQEQIANLRMTPDIVINVVYRPTTEIETDKQRQAFTDKYLKPQGAGVKTAKEYFAEREENVRKFGRFIKKEGEDNVEWEKRLGETYSDNTKKIKSLNNQLKNSANLSKIDKNAKEDELETLIQQNKVLDDIKNAQGFDFNQFVNKGKGSGRRGGKGTKPEDEVAKALKDELSLIKEMQSNYDKLRKAGVDTTTALEIASSGYGKTLNRINAILTKFGISMFNASDFVGKDADPNVLLKKLQEQRATLLKSGKVKLSSLKDLDVEIQRLNVDVKVYNMKKVTDGLNNELSKLKEEYELAVELDANPELGDMFTDMFGLDTTEFPKSIDEYMWKVNDAFEKAVDDMNLDEKGKFFDIFTANSDDWKQWAETVHLSEEALKEFSAKFIEAKDYTEKWVRDTIKATQELEYKLADTNGKIAIEQEKLENLKQRLAQETNEEQKRLLELQIQDQENAIARLKDEAVATLYTYKNLFNSIVEHSARVTRKLAQQWKGALENAKKESDESYTITDPISGETSNVSEEKYNKLLDQVNRKLRETQGSFEKIKETLTKGEDGIVDWAKGIELIGDETKKVADIFKEVGSIAEQLGLNPDAVEIINDIGESLDGLATASQGLSQVLNGDLLGGSFNIFKGLWQSVSSWFDNGNKKIDRKVKESERSVARLEVAYKSLERAVENSMGTAETKARQAVKANKELQLVELENQLRLEKSRKKKNRDEDKIIQLEGQIQDLKFEIEDLGKAIADTLLGSDIKSAAEAFVDTWVSAWKEGEKTLDAINEKMDEMIYNLIKKAATSAIVGKIIKPLYDAVDQYTSDKSMGGAELTTDELKALADLAAQLGVKIDTALGAFYNNLEAQNIINKGASAGNLSALQAGIQGITEETAGALEAYMNIVSQQVFLHTDLLTQIRDAVVVMDGDIQMGTQAQMLLQLQQSYAVQMAIQTILEGWSNANGMAVKVELIN